MTNVQEKAHSNTGDLLKTLRKDKNYTLQAVADAIGCSPSYLHRLENNSRKNPSISWPCLYDTWGISQNQ